MKTKNKKVFILIFLFSLSFFYKTKASDYYWVGGTGNWSDYSNHWATTSGGLIFHVQAPGPFDNVFFDANSFAATGQTITIDSTLINCANMDWSGVQHNPTFVGFYIDLNIYGSLTLNSSMNWNFVGGSYVGFKATTPGKTITTAGLILSAMIDFDGIGGGWTLMDSFVGGNNVYLHNGTLNTNNQVVSCGAFMCNYQSGGTVTLRLGTTTLTCGTWYITSSATTTLDADSSTIICNAYFNGDNSHVYNDVTCSECNMNNNNIFHDVVCHYKINGGSNNTFHNVLFDGFNSSLGTISGNNIFHKATFINVNAVFNSNSTFDTLFFNNPGNTITFNSGTTQTINNALLANGSCTALINFQSSQAGSFATINKSSGTVTLNYSMLKDIHATGGASFVANNSINLGNNTGWTINSPAPQNLYWVGGSGNWDDGNHWSTSSGGTGGSCVPTPFDNVFFDANSFTSTGQTVTLNIPSAYCNNMDWSGVQHNPTFVGFYIDLNIYGSLTLNSSMNWNFVGGSYVGFKATTPGKTITTAGLILSAMIDFDGIGGGWTLMDSFVGGNNVYLHNGTLNTNNQVVSCGAFMCNYQSGGTVTLRLGTTTLTCGTWYITSSATTTLDADSSTIICNAYFNGDNSHVYNDVTCSECNMNNNNIFHDVVCHYKINGGSNNTFHNVLFDGFNSSLGTISGNNIFHKATFINVNAVFNSNSTFDTLFFNNPGNTITFNSGTTQTINNALLANGSCTALINFQSSQAGSFATINKSSGTVTLNYSMLKDIHATGGASFVANNSINLGNNTGWTINSPAPQNLYWVGGSGNWDDGNHWSTSSGGTGGSCVPTPFDNVFFDANSFTSTGQTVTLNIPSAYCNNMDWSGVQHNPTFVGFYIDLNIYGSLTLNSSMNWNFVGGSYVGFKATTPGKTITTAGLILSAMIDFDGIGGGWTLMDSFVGGNNVYLHNGTLNTNNQVVSCGAFMCNYQSGGTVTLRLGTTTLTCGTWYITSSATTTLDADSSTIICNAYFNGDNSHVYNDVTCSECNMNNNNIFHDVVCHYKINGGSNNTFHNVLFDGFNSSLGTISGNNIFHKATFINVNAVFNSNSTFDTLFFNNPGNTITFNSGTTQTVNNALLANSLPGFPIAFQSSSVGNAATINKNIGSVCLNYLLMQDIYATGGAAFFAGDYSTDLGNNTGWSFTSCAPAISNVWPGDANYDLICNNLDILNIGVAYNDTGYTRAGASLTWVAQPGLDWLSQFLSGTNAKHADCDGNGVVNALDTLAVSLNYGQTHPFRLSSNENTTSAGTDLYFDMPTGSLVPGSNVSIPVNLGTTMNPANNVYGIAFTINYDPAFIQAGSMYMDYAGSWLATPLNYIHLEKDFSATGNLDMAACRINHQNVSGSGLIATLHFTVANNASGLLTLSFSDVLAISNNEIPIPVNPQSGSVPTGIDELSENGDFSFFPNPVIDYLYFGENNSSVSRVMIYDCFGRQVADIFADRKKILLGNLSQGMYMIYVFDKDLQKVFVAKFIKD